MTGWTPEQKQAVAKAIKEAGDRIYNDENDDSSVSEACDVLADAALSALPSPSAARDALEEQLWGIIDSNGPNGLPSDIVDAVRLLVQRWNQPASGAVDAPLRECGYCHTWRSKPCAEGCCWSLNDPTSSAARDKALEALLARVEGTCGVSPAEEACRLILRLIDKYRKSSPPAPTSASGLGEPKLPIEQTTDLRKIVREHFGVPTSASSPGASPERDLFECAACGASGPEPRCTVCGRLKPSLDVARGS